MASNELTAISVANQESDYEQSHASLVATACFGAAASVYLVPEPAGRELEDVSASTV